MGKQSTPMKKRFALHFAECGDITQASKLAGYAHPPACYKMMRKDENGVILDEVMRSLLKSAGVEVVEPKRVALINNIPVTIARAISARGADSPDPEVDMTLDSIKTLMWSFVNDPDTPAGPKAGALSVLLKWETENVPVVELDPTAIRAKIKLLLGQCRDS